MSEKEQAARLNQQLPSGLIAVYNAMLAFKKYKSSPVVISRNGQLLWVPAKEMPPAEADSQTS